MSKQFDIFLVMLIMLVMSVTLNASDDWNTHRTQIMQTPALTHYCTFEDVTQETLNGEQVQSKNPGTQGGHFVGKRNGGQFELVDGVFADKKAMRLDHGYFEIGDLMPPNKAFSVEIRFRKNGMGTLTGNDGSKNGTFVGMGDGYWSGMRLTTGYPNQHLSFDIGRPQPSSAISLYSNEVVHDGDWQHLTATWDGKQMRTYLNGIVTGAKNFDGVFTKANWGLRIGFNDAGIGSLNIDVDEVAVYDRGLTPCEVFEHATFTSSMSSETQAAIVQLTDLIILRKNASKIFDTKELDAIVKETVPACQSLPATGRGTVLLMFAKLAPPETSRQFYRIVARSNDYPVSLKLQVLRQYIPEAGNTPVIKASLDDYQQMLAMPGLMVAEKERIQKMIDQIRQLQATQNQVRPNAESPGQPTPREIFAQTNRPAKRFYVSPNGADGNDGSEQAPFATLVEARDAIRTLRADNQGGLPPGGVEVLLHRGVYPIRETLQLQTEDSGTVESPIVYRNVPGETPELNGGLELRGAFQKVTDETVLAKLPKNVAERLMVADLKSIGLTGPVFPIKERGFGKSGASAAPWFEVYIDGKPQQIARYPNYDAEKPNDCFVKTGHVAQGNSDTPSQSQPGIFKYNDEHINRWESENDVWLFGYWTHLWAANSHPVASIDPSSKTITMATPDGYGFRENMPFYVFNILSEIDVPGEWYLDRANNRLYMLPPLDADGKSVDLNAASVRVPVFSGPFIDCKNVSHVTFFGLTMRDCAGSAFRADGAERLTVAGCTIERMGCWGIAIHNAKESGVYGCDLNWLGGGGIELSGGDPKTLTRGDNFIENCTVRHFTLVDRVYAPAVSLDGVGNCIANNEFSDSPHHGIRMGGYDLIVEYNRIDRVVQESDDQSGIDMWGNPVCRGNVIRYNYWSNIGNQWDVAGQSGIRLDDMISGVSMHGNIFVRSAGGRFGAIQIHGGKDNIAANNLIIDSQAAFSFSPWGEKHWLENLKPDIHFWKRSTIEAGINPLASPHIDRYPDLAELPKNADRNSINHNIAFVTRDFALNEHGQNDVHENIVFDQSVMREIFANSDWFQVSDDGTHVTLPPYDSTFYRVTGFQPIPYENIGNYQDPQLPNRR